MKPCPPGIQWMICPAARNHHPGLGSLTCWYVLPSRTRAMARSLSCRLYLAFTRTMMNRWVTNRVHLFRGCRARTPCLQWILTADTGLFAFSSTLVVAIERCGFARLRTLRAPQQWTPLAGSRGKRNVNNSLEGALLSWQMWGCQCSVLIYWHKFRHANTTELDCRGRRRQT